MSKLMPEPARSRPTMFVEVVAGPRRDWELVRHHSRLLDEPPDGLLSCVVTPVGADEVHGVLVWETAGQRGEWAARVMVPLFESGALGDVTSDPSPVTPIDVYVRPRIGPRSGSTES